jgi:NAD dependent epimerase/dehydratase family enzyme
MLKSKVEGTVQSVTAHDVLHTLAEEARKVAVAAVDAQVQKVDASNNLTDNTADVIVNLSEMTANKLREARKNLEEIRTFRMALTTEASQIEAALKVISRVNVAQISNDLAKLLSIAKDPAISAFLKGVANAN